MEKGGILINKQFEYCYFVNNGQFFYEGQILKYYNIHDVYIQDVILNKFIKHYHKRNKEVFLCVNILFPKQGKTVNQTFKAEKCLGTIFKTNFSYVFDK